MNHYSYEEWVKYVKDEMNDRLREELEGHLYTCDQCLERYLQAVTENETSLPILPDEYNFTDRVMEMVPISNKNVSNVEIVPSVPVTESASDIVVMMDSVPDTAAKKPLYQRAGFHYLLAAAATLLLMFSGAFQSLASYASGLEKPIIQEKKPKPSVTEGVINKTFAWMDSLEKKEANKK